MKTFRTILAAAVFAALLASISAQTVAVLGFESDNFCRYIFL